MLAHPHVAVLTVAQLVFLMGATRKRKPLIFFPTCIAPPGTDPSRETGDKFQSRKKTHVAFTMVGTGHTPNLRAEGTDRPDQLHLSCENDEEETNLYISDKPNEVLDEVCFNKNADEVTISTSGASKQKSSLQEDVLQNVNNLRLSVNKNRIIGKMRKISITELNKRTRSSKHAGYCRFAFYTTITLLSFLFLYLIYQNLFIPVKP